MAPPADVPAKLQFQPLDATEFPTRWLQHGIKHYPNVRDAASANAKQPRHARKHGSHPARHASEHGAKPDDESREQPVKSDGQHESANAESDAAAKFDAAERSNVYEQPAPSAKSIDVDRQSIDATSKQSACK